MSGRSRRWLLFALLGAAGLAYWAIELRPPTMRETADRSSLDAAGVDASSMDDGLELGEFAVSEVDVRAVVVADEYAGDVPTVPRAAIYQQLVDKATGGRAEYDPHLSQAAAGYLANREQIGDDPPDQALVFLLHSAGAPDGSVGRVFTETASDDDAELRAAIIRAVAGSPPPGRLFVGIAELRAPGPLPRRVAVFAVRREYELAPTARLVSPGESWRVRGRLPPGFTEATGSVLATDGSILEVEIADDGNGYFRVDVPTVEPGQVWLSLDGTFVDRGPGKLLQLAVTVGETLPRMLTLSIDPVEEPWDDVNAAESYALALLNRDREAHGVSPLEIDSRLSEIARNHSEDMRDAGYFGHQSPSTGLVSDRLTAAKYRAVSFAENLAKNDSVAGAQRALLWSIGHRRNLLAETPTRIGIGVALAEEEDNQAIYVTQIFARRVETLDADDAVAKLLGRINSARGDAGLQALPIDDELAEVVALGARAALTADSLDEVTRQVADTVAERVDLPATISAATAYDVQDVAIPPAAVKAEAVGITIAVIQSETDLRGKLGVVFVVIAEKP